MSLVDMTIESVYDVVLVCFNNAGSKIQDNWVSIFGFGMLLIVDL